MSIFISGASGFIGRAVVRKLLSAGEDVTAFGRTPAEGAPGASSVVVDLSSGEGLKALPWHRCEGLIHLAAAGVKRASRNLKDAVDINVLGTQRLFDEIAAQKRVFPILIARTFYEDFLSAVPAFRENPYVVTKAASTAIAKSWSAQHLEFPVIGARIFQVYGRGDDPRNVLPYVVHCLRAKQHVLLGSGRAEKDWIHVDDAADAIRAMMACSRPGWNDWDAGTGVVVSVRQAVETLTTLAAAADGLLIFDATKDGPDAAISARASKAPTGWRPRTSLNEGLIDLLESVS